MKFKLISAQVISDEKTKVFIVWPTLILSRDNDGYMIVVGWLGWSISLEINK